MSIPSTALTFLYSNIPIKWECTKIHNNYVVHQYIINAIVKVRTFLSLAMEAISWPSGENAKPVGTVWHCQDRKIICFNK